MTERVHALTVVFEEDLREDDVQELRLAILKFRGVLSVECHVVDIGAHVARERARREFGRQLLKILSPEPRKI